MSMTRQLATVAAGVLFASLTLAVGTATAQVSDEPSGPTWEVVATHQLEPTGPTWD